MIALLTQLIGVLREMVVRGRQQLPLLLPRAIAYMAAAPCRIPNALISATSQLMALFVLPTRQSPVQTVKHLIPILERAARLRVHLLRVLLVRILSVFCGEKNITMQLTIAETVSSRSNSNEITV